MNTEIIVPAAGESVTEADIATWYKADGDYVELDEPILELETDKASLDINAEKAGILRINVADGTVQVGDVLGHIEAAEAPVETTGGQTVSTTADLSTAAPSNRAVDTKETSVVGKQSSYATGHPSPSAAKLLAEKNIPTDAVSGTGKDGRITKADAQSAQTEMAVGSNTAVAAAPAPVASEGSKAQRTERREKMSRLRRTIASRLVEAQQTAALLTTFNEVDMSAIMAIRKTYKEPFKEKYDVGLGFMSFFTKAVSKALTDFPIMNAAVDGETIVYHDYCDIGIAVSTPKGLVVPVLRDTQDKSFAEIEREILDYALRGRDGKLSPDDMAGGTFTITNGGTFGSMMSTPILSPPQSGILGMHNIVKRAVVVGDEIKIRPMMYLAVTYDHRIIDGADAVRFLVTIKGLIEDPNRLLIGL